MSFVLSSGSLSPNIVANPTYNGPSARLSPSHSQLAPGSEMRGHLVWVPWQPPCLLSPGHPPQRWDVCRRGKSITCVCKAVSFTVAVSFRPGHLFFFLGAWVNCGFNEGGRNFDLDIEGGSRKWPWVRAFAWIIDATDEWAYCFHGNVVPEIWMERGRIIMVLLPCRWHCDVLISVLPSDVTAVQARLLIQRPCNPLYRQWSVQLFKF